MTAPILIMWVAVIAVGGVSAFRNPTAAILVLAWMAGAAVGIHTNNPLPLGFFPFADITAVALIMCKDEQTRADRIVLMLFPVCWVFYVSGIPDARLIDALWAITLTQFLAVGWETFLPVGRRLAEKAVRHPDEPWSLLVPAYRVGGRLG